jgi:hypothetical protein
VIGVLPERLARGSRAFRDAAAALRTYAGALRDAQQRASGALRILEDVERRQQTVGPSSDGGAEAVRAVRLFEEARSDLERTAARVARLLDEAAALAPQEPALLSRMLHTVGDVAGGAWESTVETGTFFFKLSPLYALVNPNGFGENLGALGEGLAQAVTHPVAFAKAVVDWDTWTTNPARAVGHLLPGAALAAVTGGGALASRARTISRTARRADDVVKLSLRGQRFERASVRIQGGTHLLGKGDDAARYASRISPKAGASGRGPRTWRTTWSATTSSYRKRSSSTWSRRDGRPRSCPMRN